jgi:hypothetical protein
MGEEAFSGGGGSWKWDDKELMAMGKGTPAGALRQASPTCSGCGAGRIFRADVTFSSRPTCLFLWHHELRTQAFVLIRQDKVIYESDLEPALHRTIAITFFQGSVYSDG